MYTYNEASNVGRVSIASRKDYGNNENNDGDEDDDEDDEANEDTVFGVVDIATAVGCAFRLYITQSNPTRPPSHITHLP